MKAMQTVLLTAGLLVLSPLAMSANFNFAHLKGDTALLGGDPSISAQVYTTQGASICSNAKGIGVSGDSCSLQNRQSLRISFSKQVDLSNVRVDDWEVFDGLEIVTYDVNGDQNGYAFLTAEYKSKGKTKGKEKAHPKGKKIDLNVDFMNVASMQLHSVGADSSFYLNSFHKARVSSLQQLANTNAVPVPAAFWLFGSALLALAGARKLH